MKSTAVPKSSGAGSAVSMLVIDCTTTGARPPTIGRLSTPELAPGASTGWTATLTHYTSGPHNLELWLQAGIADTLWRS